MANRSAHAAASLRGQRVVDHYALLVDEDRGLVEVKEVIADLLHLAFDLGDLETMEPHGEYIATVARDALELAQSEIS